MKKQRNNYAPKKYNKCNLYIIEEELIQDYFNNKNLHFLPPLKTNDTKRENHKELSDIVESPLKIATKDSYKLKYNSQKEACPIRKNQKNNSREPAQVIRISPSELPKVSRGLVLGMYDPRTHTIYIANNLSSYVEKFVYHHEVAHSLGINSERAADAYAAARVGYNLRPALAA
ncbi:MAG: hypothetical protein Q7S74_06600 [Nanoarchaeota archaeon]|nr:hypothetical protein [Nanoarchaeota archaeon]